jgi:hypothetical protein
MLAEIFMLRLEAVSRASGSPMLDKSDARFVAIEAMPVPARPVSKQRDASGADLPTSHFG